MELNSSKQNRLKTIKNHNKERMLKSLKRSSFKNAHEKDINKEPANKLNS